MSDSTAPKSNTREALLKRLEDPSLSDAEVERIRKKLEVLKDHG